MWRRIVSESEFSPCMSGKSLTLLVRVHALPGLLTRTVGSCSSCGTASRSETLTDPVQPNAAPPVPTKLLAVLTPDY